MLLYLRILCVVGLASAEKVRPSTHYITPTPLTSYAEDPVDHYEEPHHHQPQKYEPSYGYHLAYSYQPVYGYQSLYSPHAYQPPHHARLHKPPHKGKPVEPDCAKNATKTWCLEDDKYPTYEIEAALQYHKDHALSLYADVADLNTELSVERPDTLEDETYLCSSKVSYILPLRAINSEGKWRVIVNNIQIHYEKLSQTTRLEECQDAGDPCPLVPHCYGSKCLQKDSYRKFLVFDPYDVYFPFTVESFRMPSSCACLLDSYEIDH